ncbi:MAG: hypothetical protein WB952_18405 [Terriglobales bacterium]
MKSRIVSVVMLALFVALSSTAWAQWSADPFTNLPLADKGNGNDQVQPKVKALPAGGWYVSWFDSDPNIPPVVGYDVYLQRLDFTGVEKFPHDGVRMATLSNSSTQDYGLDVDTEGHALLAFLDTREGSNQQVTAEKVDLHGRRLWGTRGVQLTSDASFHAVPKITGTSDGDVVVAWTSDSNVVVQKLDRAGHPLWGTGMVFSESGFNYTLADLHAADNGSVILSWVRAQGFFGNKQLRANKISATGTLLWGAQNLAIFDSGSLQFGNFPYFILDGSGGAVFTWYTAIPALQCYAQHIRADGTEAFPHNGSAVSTNRSNVRVSPTVSYRAATDETFVFWTEEDSLQVVNGVYAQKFDATGTRRWGHVGKPIVPIGNDQQIFVQSVQVGSGALVFWVDQADFGEATIQAARLNQNGRMVCPQFAVSSVLADKSRLVADINLFHLAVVAFEDDRIGNNGIYIQNVNRDCSLGPWPSAQP